MNEPLHQADYAAYLAELSEPETELLRLYRPAAAVTILDIGACEGEDTVRYARRFPRARLFAFEPLPANQALVRANLQRYGVTSAELVPLALSDRRGEATFHVSSGRPPEKFAGDNWNYGNKSSSLLAPAAETPMYGWVEFKETITVPTETLDGFCAARGLGRIDFIHMDVQGAEHLVLRGGARTLPRVTAIWLEVSRRELYHGQALETEIGRLMRQHGFILCRESYRSDGVEGDHLYLNPRHPRTWPRLAATRLRALARRLKHAIKPPPAPLP